MNAQPHQIPAIPELLKRIAVKPQEVPLTTEARWAAVSILFHEVQPGDFHLLLIKRANHERDPWSGHMAFPGGRQEPSDADLLQTALRETREELGLDLESPARLVGRLNDMQAYSRSRPIPLFIRPFVFHWQGQHPAHTPELKPNQEVDEVVWIPLEVLLKGEGRGTLQWQRDNQSIELPCIRYRHYTVWGLTYYMLMELLERLQANPSAQEIP